MEYIDKTEELTGNSPVDFVILKDGRFYGFDSVDRPSIDLVTA
jgi:hypothetical protein